jgi:ATP-dependent HslUV protease, peptidase subunit HslV
VILFDTIDFGDNIRRMRHKVHSTTVLLVRTSEHVVMACDGQVTFGNTVMKTTARKVRRIYSDKILAGFAGSAADGFALVTRLETKLETHRGNLSRAAVELAKEWRTDKVLRHLDALMLVTDIEHSYLISGNGDLIEPDDGIAAIGSGGPYALAAARALTRHSSLSAREIALESMKIAAGICIFTNESILLEEL